MVSPLCSSMPLCRFPAARPLCSYDSHGGDPSRASSSSTPPQQTRDPARLPLLPRRAWIALSLCFAGAEVFSPKQGAGGAASAAQEGNEHGSGDASEQQQKKKTEEEEEKEDGSVLINPLLSFFDPNEKTKSGRSLPKGYLKSARLVVKSLKESLGEASENDANVRRAADSAKGAIRDFLQNWRGQKSVSSEESYKALESVFKILGNFYAKEGPRALLPSGVKSQILEELTLAEASL